MGTYILLGSWTDQGIRNVKDSPKRLDVIKKAIKALGGEVKSFHMTMGGYDFVITYDAPDDATAARFTLATAQAGNVRSVTLKAFSEKEYRNIIGSIGKKATRGQRKR